MEVAGLVLGILPVVLSALDYYDQGMNLYRQYRRYRREFRMIHTNLKLEHFKFKDACTKVLSQSFRDYEIKRMLEKPEGEMWRTPENLERLRRQLGEALDIFIVKVEDIYETMEEFKGKLGIPIDKEKLENPSLFEEHYKRLRFSLRKKDYEDLLSRLRQNNADLVVLTSPTVAASSQHKKSGYPAAYVETVRKCVTSTYTSLKTHWQCRCKQFHKVIVRLGRVDAARGSSTQSYDQDPCFHIIFNYGLKQSSGASSIPWDWKELRLLSTTQDSMQDVPKNSSPLSVLDQGETRFLQNGSAQTEKRKKFKLRFADDENEKDCMQTSTKTLRVDSLSSLKLSPSSDQLTCICEALSEQRQLIADLGYIIDCSAKRRHDFIPFEYQKPVNIDTSILSLENVLLTPRCSQRLLPRRLRMRLAAVLSMSLLEYGQTPWSDAGWNKKDILFIQRSDTPSYEDMFVSESIVPDHQTPQLPSTSIGFVRNKSLYALGILLIELCFGKSAEAICNDYDVPSVVAADGSPKFPPDYNNIKVLIQAVADESDATYSSAVRRCLYCSFDCMEDTLDYEEFRRAVYEGVVLPLEDNYRHMSGQNIDVVHSDR